MKRFLLKMQTKTSFRNIYRTKKTNICIDGFDPGYVGVGYLKSTIKNIVLRTLPLPPSHTGGRQRKIYFFTNTKPLLRPFGRSKSRPAFSHKTQISHRNARMTHYFCFPPLTLHFLLLQQTQSLCVHFSLSLLRKRVLFSPSKMCVIPPSPPRS